MCLFYIPSKDENADGCVTCPEVFLLSLISSRYYQKEESRQYFFLLFLGVALFGEFQWGTYKFKMSFFEGRVHGI